jgi:hypothetical protein
VLLARRDDEEKLSALGWRALPVTAMIAGDERFPLQADSAVPP